MPKSVSKAKILLINVPLEVRKIGADTSIKIRNPSQMKVVPGPGERAAAEEGRPPSGRAAPTW